MRETSNKYFLLCWYKENILFLLSLTISDFLDLMMFAMKVLVKLENKALTIGLSMFMITIIGIADYVSEPDISFSIFYIIPTAWLALCKLTTKKIILVNTMFASVVWFIAEYLTRDYANGFYPVWNAVVRFLIFLIIGLLIHNLKEKQEKMDKMNVHLKHINQEKNKFIGIASHDLRSSISGIFSFSELLLMDKSKIPDPETIHLLTMIRNTSKNSLDLLENLLDISKIESGILELNKQPINYYGFLEEHIHFNQFIADNKSIDLKLERAPDPVMIKADEKYLSQVIDNLISNAIKYSNKNSNVLIRVSKTSSHMLRTEVIDNGKGIPLNEQTKLFNYFQKASTQPTAGEKSSGLGLAIARRIVVEHKGTIGLESEEGKGSMFYYELPML